MAGKMKMKEVFEESSACFIFLPCALNLMVKKNEEESFVRIRNNHLINYFYYHL
jgi:hypothetical protein